MSVFMYVRVCVMWVCLYVSVHACVCVHVCVGGLVGGWVLVCACVRACVSACVCKCVFLPLFLACVRKAGQSVLKSAKEDPGTKFFKYHSARVNMPCLDLIQGLVWI